MTRALFIIDVQNDFTEGGALGVERRRGRRRRRSPHLLAEHRGRLRHRVRLARLARRRRRQRRSLRDRRGPTSSTTGPCTASPEGPAPSTTTRSTPNRIDIHIRKGQGAAGILDLRGRDRGGRRLVELLDEPASPRSTSSASRPTTASARRARRARARPHVRVLTDLVGRSRTPSRAGERPRRSWPDAGADLVLADQVES